MEKVQCYFLDKDDTILFVRDDAVSFVVEEADLELDCSFPIDTQKPISKGMKIGFYDIDNKLVFYEIRTVEEDAISMTTAIYAEHALIPEMLEDPITDIRASAATASEALAAVLSGTRWQVRNSIDTQRASCRFWYINRWEALKLIREKWQVAFSFSWEIDGSQIVSRYVDIISKEPVNRGKRFDTLKDISALKVAYDDTETCTALYGRGADEKTDEKDQDEQGNTYDHKISFASVVWSTQSGDPANKPSGQQYVEDVQATAIYGRSGRMRAQFIDFSNCTDPAELLRLTWNALQLVNKPKVTIKATVADLEKIWGYKHEAVRLNDWGLVIADSTMTQIETTVVDVKRDYINPQQTKITLGNKVITISDIQAEYQAHTRKVEEEARRAGGAASAASEKIDQTQQELRLEFAGAQSAIYSSLYMTAEELEIEFTNGISDLHSQIHVTAEELKTEFQKSESKIYSSIRQTAEDLQVEFGSVDSDLYSTIHASAEALQTEFNTANSAIYSRIVQTAETFETELGSAVSDLHSSISQTADAIQTELHTSQSAIYSYVVQTAEGMEAEFGNSLSGAYAYIAASADEIKTELHTSESSLYSEISQTASGIRVEFGNSLSGVYSSISSTASSLQSEFSSADSSIYSRIKQTKGTIETELHSTESSLSSFIQQQADKISLVVQGTGSNASIKAAEIVAAINDAGSSVIISADHINLDGYVTAGMLETAIAAIDNIVGDLTINGALTVGGNLLAGSVDAESFSGYKVDGTSIGLGNAVNGFGTPTSSSGQISIPYTTLSGGSDTINFNIADTQYYQDGVSAAYIDGWDAARAKVVPPSQGTDTSFEVKVPSATEGDQQTYTFTIQKGATPSSSGYASVALSGTVVGRISIGDWYTAGYTAGQGDVTLSASGWTGPSGTNTVTATNGQTLPISLPTFSVSGGTTFTNHKTTVYFSTASVSAPLKSKEVDATSEYNDGYTAGAGDVTLSAGGWTGPSGTNTVTASNGETQVIHLPPFTTSGGTSFNTSHKTTVNFSTASVTSGPLASKEVDASSVYNEGYTDGYDAAAGASYDHMTFSSSDIGDPSSDSNPGSVRCTAYDGSDTTIDYGTLYLYLTQGSWNSSNKKAINIRVGSSSGNRIARLWVTAPSSSVDVGTPYINNNAQGYIRAAVKVNGQTYYGSAVKLTSSQISSWGGPI